MTIIPAIDILNRNVVRLKEGNLNKVTRYPYHLSDLVKQFLQKGIELIHLIDLNGANGNIYNEKYLWSTFETIPVKIQLGGGIRSIEKIQSLLNHGVYRVMVGTMALTQKKLLKQLKDEQNQNRIIIAIDVKNEVLKYNGWHDSASINLFHFIDNCLKIGYERFLCTDISKDGLLNGCNIELYYKIKQKFPSIKLIASGGIRDMNDILQLSETGVESVVVGKAILEQHISLDEIAEWNSTAVNNYQQ